MGTRVLVIEYDAARRNQLAGMLSRAEDVQLVAAFGTLQDALALAHGIGNLEVLLIGVDQPEMRDMKFWATIKALLWPAVQIVALTRGADRCVLENVLGVGVNGLHPPDLSPEALVRAVKRAARGEVDFDPALAERARLALMGPPVESLIWIGGLEIDLESRELRRWSTTIELTTLQFDVLAYLAQSHPDPVTPTQLLKDVWRTTPERGGTVDQVKSCIKRLRRKIEPHPKHPRYLFTVREKGYLLQDPLRAPHPSQFR